jgi:hypothetical protein
MSPAPPNNIFLISDIYKFNCLSRLLIKLITTEGGAG